MYRVELKGEGQLYVGPVRDQPEFLMYRVELKGEFGRLRPGSGHVPNVPCGVESSLVVLDFPFVF